MGELSVSLPGALAVVPSQAVLTKLPDLRQRFPYVPDIDGMISGLRQLTQHGGVPARVDDSGDKTRLFVYCEDYFLLLFPLTQRNDLYRLGHVDRIRARDMNLLAQRALRLTPQDWLLFAEPRDAFPYRLSTQWPTISDAWHRLDSPSATAPRLSRRHREYLDGLDQIIEATRDMDLSAARTAPPLPYRRFRPTTERRYTAKSVYVFELATPARLSPGTLVQVEGQPDLRGTVLRVAGRDVTVKFAGAIDERRLPAAGRLEHSTSTTVYDKQTEAVRDLRDGGSVNPHLLPVLADHEFQPFVPDFSARPEGTPDSGQLDAFAKACGVPDLMLILGPPGTGKTWTIAEITRACAARGERVLLSSHTHRAVDNVLESLSDSLLSLRVGREDAMTEHGRSKMIEAQADQLQDRLRRHLQRGTPALLLRFGKHYSAIEKWLGHLAEEFDALTAADRRLLAIAQERAHAEQTISARYRARLTALNGMVSQYAVAMEHQAGLAQRWREKQSRAAERSKRGVLAPVHRWRENRCQRRAERAEQQHRHAATAHGEAQQQHGQTEAELATVLAQDPTLRRLATERDTTETARGNAVGELDRAYTTIRAATHELATPPSTDGKTTAEWADFGQWCQEVLPLLRVRALLLEEWRTQLEQPTEELHRELVLYADVVAATCVGVATSDLLADLEFDVVVVDEAGQISLPNLVVPLVRAKRAILVGDHKQLPPIAGNEVEEWLRQISRQDNPDKTRNARDISRVLTISAFESLFPVTPPTHRATLTAQRRMPEVIANFVSDQFYHGALTTVGDRPHSKALFGSPFAIVDTSDLPLKDRRESQRTSTESWRQPGYHNDREATIITRLVGHHAEKDMEWAVIVPYRAQLEKITRMLTNELGDEQLVSDNVGTVDAFQGGERDLVIYGCTRSNDRGDIGFLRELRRLNVAITRAKRQLVVVGDMRTLTNARDQDFRALMRSMVTYVREHGDLSRSRAVGQRLRRLENADHD